MMQATADTTAQRLAQWTAVGLGGANTAVTVYWLAGGMALLDTVGGEIEAWGRRRTPGVVLVLAAVAVVKGAVALSPVVLARLPMRLRRPARAGAWIAAAALTAYGGLLTVGGWLVQADIVTRSEDADDRALAWHAFLWDPWFLLWGVALATWLWLTSPARNAPRPAP